LQAKGLKNIGKSQSGAGRARSSIGFVRGINAAAQTLQHQNMC
jgi:hypothetical protein